MKREIAIHTRYEIYELDEGLLKRPERLLNQLFDDSYPSEGACHAAIIEARRQFGYSQSYIVLKVVYAGEVRL